MKGFVTFTLAAGVAITSTSIAHAEGIAKGRLSVTNPGAALNQGPATTGLLNGLVLDRAALNRELAKLQPDTDLTDEMDDGQAPVKATAKTSSVWTF